MQTLPHTRSCFVCGESNPRGLKLIMETDGECVYARWYPAQEHAGFMDTIHGGLISTVLDELMVWACAIKTRRFAYCAELTVRFQKPIRPAQEVRVSAQLESNRRDRIFEANATMHDGQGTLLASGTGKYLPIAPEQMRAMASDFVGSAATWLDLADRPTGLGR